MCDRIRWYDPVWGGMGWNAMEWYILERGGKSEVAYGSMYCME
jgi:hypothetical protein